MSDARIGDPSDQQPEEAQTPRKRGLFRRGEDGLTTLEWLLIVAAVAGLAALAVVLVQNVVDQTAEQIGGSSARETAAKVAAQAVMTEADSDTQPDAAETFGEWQTYYTNKCNRIEITFSDAEVTIDANFDGIKGTTLAATPVTDALVEQGDVDATTDSTSTGANNAIAECRVS